MNIKAAFRQIYVQTKGIRLLLIMSIYLCCGCVDANKKSNNLMVFAASSLTDVLNEIKADYEEEYDTDITINFAGSSTLARQILYGANVDIFISANKAWAHEVAQKKAILKRNNILGNQLAVIARLDSVYKPSKLKDLLNPKIQHIAIADPQGVPAGVYAKKALMSHGLWQQLQHKFIIGSDVRHTMAHIENGGAQAGFVYVTDQLISNSTNILITLGPSSSGIIEYPMLLLKNSNQNSDTTLFFDYLVSDEALQVFRKHGFIIHTH